MALLPTTHFLMGSNTGEPDETPPHDVTVAAFLLDRTEVTNEDFAACADAEVCRPATSASTPGLSGDRQPVVGVTWNDAHGFCTWAGKRLPTEAEFERAIRGAVGRVYPFDGNPNETKANFRGNRDGFSLTAPVGSFPLGISKEAPLLDLVGNAAEWTADWYDPAYYTSSETWNNPTGPSAISGEKVVRGGSHLDPDYLGRGSSRSRMEVNQSSNAVGFRCAADP
jgi:formylglycine-generating enzyme required for sulfatase activity